MNSFLTRRFDKFNNVFLDRRIVLAMDLFLSVFSSGLVIAAGFILHMGSMLTSQFISFWLISSLLTSFLSFVIFKTYAIIIRHISFRNVGRFGVACAAKDAILLLASMLCGFFQTAILWFLCMDFVLSFILLCSVRLVMIYVYDLYKSSVRTTLHCPRVLVYGLSEASMSAAARFRNSKHYNVIGFISPDTSVSKSVFDQKVAYYFRDEEDVQTLSKKLSLGGILFMSERDLLLEKSRLVQFCIDNEISVLVAPNINEVSGDDANAHFHVRQVKIEDLLGREEIHISIKEIKSEFRDSVVMVTGAAGSIGSEICRQLAGFGIKKLILYDNAETPMHNLRLELEEKYPDLSFVPIVGDVRLVTRLDFAFRTHRPQFVFHAAAYKHVPLMEENPCEAVLVNVAGTRNVADKCIEYGARKMVMISTDKAVNPTNIMGCTKRLAEIYVQSLGQAIETGKVKGETKFVTTRFGNVLGSNGSVIPRFRDQISKGGPVTVTDRNITRYFMTIPEACRLVLEAAVLPTENRICVFDMGDPVKIDTLARKMIELSGYVPDKDIKIVYTGLRPGEKLYEEVLSNVENTDPTSHDRIRIAKVRQYEYSDAHTFVEQLEELSRAVNIPDMVRLMKQIVPEYVSNNSRFQEYDKK